MHRFSLNLPEDIAKKQSTALSPNRLKHARFFKTKSSRNKKRSMPLPERFQMLTQEEFLAQLTKNANLKNLTQSQSVQNLYPYRPKSDGLVQLSNSSSQRELPPIRANTGNANAMQSKLFKNNLKFNNKKGLKLNMSQPVMSVKSGVVSFGDTTNMSNYQSFHTSNNQYHRVYGQEASPTKQKKALAKTLAKKPKKLQKYLKRNKNRARMEKTLKRRLSHENIYGEKEMNSGKNTVKDQLVPQRLINTANSEILFSNESEKHEFLEKQEEFQNIAAIPSIETSHTITTSNTNVQKHRDIVTPKIEISTHAANDKTDVNTNTNETDKETTKLCQPPKPTKSQKRLNKTNSKRKQSIALSMDHANDINSLHNQQMVNDTDTNESQSLMINLRLPGSNDKKLVYSVQSKNKSVKNVDVSEILNASSSQELTNTLSLTEETLQAVNTQRGSEMEYNATYDAASEGGGHQSRRSLPRTGDISFRSLEASVYNKSRDFASNNYTKHGNTDTVYLQNIGYTHRSSNTVRGSIKGDEYGTGMFLAKIKHHLSDPAQKRLQKSKSAMLLHEPRQIRDVLTKLRHAAKTDANCKWEDEIQLDDELKEWWDEVRLFKTWVHRENWKKWVEI